MGVRVANAVALCTPRTADAATPYVSPMQNISSCIGEWGYEFHAFAQNNPSFASQPCVDMTMATKLAHNQVPRDRHEALTWMNAYYDCRKQNARDQDQHGGTMDLIGHYFYSGLGLERGGATVVASEIQENIDSIQFHWALTRGVARQFRLPWAIDVSPWDAGWITDYSTGRPWHAASAAGGDGGHSISLFKRSWWLSYLSGANHLIAEAGGVNLFYQNLTDEGVYSLSPLGDAASAFANFTSADIALGRATPYAPVAVILPHAHGYGLGLVSGPRPKAWAHFDLTGTDQVAWQLLQALWPGSWTIKSTGVAAESNYLVSSPFGDSFDVLNEANSIKTLPLYRAAVFTGNVTLGSAEIVTLREWVQEGGTAIIFASQLSTAAGAATASLVGASLQGQDNLTSKLVAVTDLETGWTQRRRSYSRADSDADPPFLFQHAQLPAIPSASTVEAPFCAPQKAANTPPYYIKTGGDPSQKVGWRGETVDKFCQQTESSCYWFSSLALCTAALSGPKKATCLPCSGCNVVSNGCPNWASGCHDHPPTPLGLTLSANATSATTLLQASTALPPGQQRVAPENVFPVALRNSIGDGTVVTVLLEDHLALDALGILPHLLARLASDVLPFEVVDSTGTNLLIDKLEMLLARRSTGWQVTIVNNNGVTKQPNAAAVVDASQRQVAMVTLKPAFGIVKSVTLTTTAAPGETRTLVVSKNSVSVTVESGDLVVLRFTQ